MTITNNHIPIGLGVHLLELLCHRHLEVQHQDPQCLAVQRPQPLAPSDREPQILTLALLRLLRLGLGTLPLEQTNKSMTKAWEMVVVPRGTNPPTWVCRLHHFPSGKSSSSSRHLEEVL